MTQRAGIDRGALAQAVGAYFIWGFLPIYFKALASVPPLEVVAHRIAWSVLLLLLVLALRRRLAALIETFATPRLLGALALSAVLIAINWLIYIWAVTHDHVAAASLGYFLNPLVNVLLGRLVLHESLSHRQWMAVALAGLGVLVLATGALSTLWISLSLALSFGCYGLIRKMAPVGPMVGLAAETILLLPAALGFLLLWVGPAGGAFGHQSVKIDALLIAGGAVTAIPLLLFASAARRMKYATIGLIQYIGPSIQFALAVLVYGEPLTRTHIIAFALIWLALIVYSLDALRQARAGSADQAPPDALAGVEGNDGGPRRGDSVRH